MIIIQIKLFSSGKINVALSWPTDLFAQPTAKGFVPCSDGGLAILQIPGNFSDFFPSCHSHACKVNYMNLQYTLYRFILWL